MPDKKKEVKPGFGTSEFAVTAGTVASVVIMSTTGVPIPPELATGGIIFLAGLYTAVRSWLKGRAE